MNTFQRAFYCCVYAWLVGLTIAVVFLTRNVPSAPSVLPHPDPAGYHCQPSVGAIGALPSWAAGGTVHTIAESPDQFNIFTVPQQSVCYFNALTPPGLGPQHNTWTTCDVSGYVPKGATAAYLMGMLIITHGYTPETADLMVFFRRDASVTSGVNETFQCVEPFVGGGQRCTASCWVPLTAQGTFQWKWMAAGYPSGTTPVYQYPAYSAYGANLRVVAYVGAN